VAQTDLNTVTARIDLYHPPGAEDDAAALAPWCQLRVAAAPPRLPYGHALWLDESGLALIDAQFESVFRLSTSMLDARSRGKSLLLQSCGVGRGKLSVLDPFAGFGLDALQLARAGCAVTAVESHPLVWLMLDDFTKRVGADVDLLHGDGMAVLLQARARWDVVYLDPMFGARRKRALPNRGLQHLQTLNGENEVDVGACLEQALDSAARRVVLKRRPKDPAHGAPSYQIRGKAVRFDVYV
jgi:16S rRNA (guanine1516-N2)-methyltransferase